MNKDQIESLKTQLLAVNCNLSNIKIQFELLNKNLEILDSSLGILYEESFGSNCVRPNLFDLEKD